MSHTSHTCCVHEGPFSINIHCVVSASAVGKENPPVCQTKSSSVPHWQSLAGLVAEPFGGLRSPSCAWWSWIRADHCLPLWAQPGPLTATQGRGSVPVTSLPSWESEAMHPGKVGTLVFPRWAILRPKPQVLTAPAPACSPGSPFSLEVFVHSAPATQQTLPSILVTPAPLFSEGVPDVAEGGVGPHAGRHLP